MGKVHLEDIDAKEQTTEFSLVRVKGTWKRKLGKANKDKGECVSAAKIHETNTDKGTTWTVVSPIVFTYKVTETQGLLDPNNDTLLLGHITDPQQLDDIKKSNKPIKRFIVVDQEVYAIYGSKITEYLEANNVLYKILALPTTEENKSMEMALQILEEVNNFCIDRRTEPIIAIGGGVCLDIVGLAASLYRRRTPYIRVPTTLLSYIDASVGAKTGVNFANCKNKLGAYIPPTASYLDLSFIQTVPRRHISNGLAEMLKKILPSLLHGEAVNIDMSYMVYVSKECGLITEEEKQRIISCMVGLELPVWHEACTMELIQRSLQDRLKHSGGLVRMPLPVGLGQAEIFNNTSSEVLLRAYEKWCKELNISSDSSCDP
ncbi:uncharacterized protein V6R79_008269 [Siganus canaliculatus]